MKNFQFNLSTNQVLATQLFEYYTKSNLSVKSSYEELEKAAKEFKDLYGLSNEETFEGIIFYDQSFYSFPDGYSSTERLMLMVGLDNFLIALKNVLSDRVLQDDEDHGIERPASPPMEVYEYVGHNELNISSSDSSYALLFGSRA